jgi:hypothetical protein
LVEVEKRTRAKRFYGDKLKRAAHLLLFRRGRLPGAKEWELRMALGEDYDEVLKRLSERLSDIDLEVKKIGVKTDESSTTGETLTPESRYLTTLKGTLSLREARMCGWRIDSLAGLAVALAYVVSKQGKASRKDVERILARKFGKWNAIAMSDAFIRAGYLAEDDSGMLYLDWRTRAEVDLRTLMSLLVEAKLE